jgi:predicted transcriptional regulator
MTDISKTEFEVLEAIWHKYPASAQDIIDQLNKGSDQEQDKTWHDKTVKTLINRMVKKGAIGFEKEGRRYYYSPLLEREAYQIKESRTIIDRLFGGKVAPLVAGFAKNQQLTKTDVDELKSLIKQWEHEND